MDLTRRKGTGHDVALSGHSCTSEYESASLSSGFVELFAIFKCKDRDARERKGCSHVCLEGILNISRCNLKKGFLSTISDVEYGCADGILAWGIVRGWSSVRTLYLA